MSKKRDENPPDDTRRNRNKTRREIASLYEFLKSVGRRLVGLERRIEQLEKARKK
jgi:hypothetical protein